SSVRPPSIGAAPAPAPDGWCEQPPIRRLLNCPRCVQMHREGGVELAGSDRSRHRPVGVLDDELTEAARGPERGGPYLRRTWRRTKIRIAFGIGAVILLLLAGGLYARQKA